MQLSDFFPEMKGWTPAMDEASVAKTPQVPNEQTQVSPYLRTVLPLPLQYSGDTIKQYNRPGISSFRTPPLPPSGIPSINAAAQSTATAAVVQAAAATPVTPTDEEELCVNLQTGTSYTLQSTDRGILVSLSNAAGGTINIPAPANSSSATSVFGQPGFVGGAGVNTSPISATPIDIPAGALIVVCVIWSDSGTSGVTDNVGGGNSYVSAGSAFKYANNFVQFYYVLNSAAKTAAVVSAAFSNTANNYTGIGVWVVPLGGTVVFDTVNLNGTTAASPSQTSGAITTTSTDEMVFAFNCDGGVGDSPPPANIPVSFTSGWTVDSTGYGALAPPFNTRNFYSSAHRLLTAIQSGLKVTSTVGNRQGGGGLPVIAFKGATATPGAPGIPQCWYTYIENTGAGTFNLTLPSIGGFTLDGSTSPLAIGPNQGLILAFNGFNWFTMRGMGGGGGGGVTSADIQNEAFTYATDTGAANAYVIAPTPAVVAYQAGQGFQFIAVHSNSGASTLAVSGLSAKAITKNGTTALASGDIVAGQLVQVIYDGTEFQMINAPGTPGSGAVTSVFGRTGAVVAVSGDYTAAQVTNAESTANKDAASGYAGLTSATMLKLPEQATAVDARTTTSEAIADSDRAKLVTFSNTSAVAATIAQAGAGSNFLAGWYCDLVNENTGIVTLTPTTSTIDGQATLILQRYEGVRIISDGANYFTVKGQPTIDSPNDADILTYIAADKRWESKSIGTIGGANASQIRGTTITATSPKPRQVLVYNEANADYEPTYIAPGRVNWHGWAADPSNNTTVNAYGGTWLVTSNTSASVNASATEPFYSQVSSPGTANNAFFGWNMSVAQVTTGIFRYSTARCILSSTGTHAGYFLGLCSSVGPQGIAQSATLAANFVGFRFWNGTDTHWQAYVGTDATHITLVDTGITPDTNSHIYEIYSDGTNFHFCIDGTRVASISVTDTNAPATTVRLGMNLWLSNQNGATTISLSTAYAYWESSV